MAPRKRGAPEGCDCVLKSSGAVWPSLVTAKAYAKYTTA